MIQNVFIRHEIIHVLYIDILLIYSNDNRLKKKGAPGDRCVRIRCPVHR